MGSAGEAFEEKIRGRARGHTHNTKVFSSMYQRQQTPCNDNDKEQLPYRGAPAVITLFAQFTNDIVVVVIVSHVSSLAQKHQQGAVVTKQGTRMLARLEQT